MVNLCSPWLSPSSVTLLPSQRGQEVGFVQLRVCLGRVDQGWPRPSPPPAVEANSFAS